MASRFLICSSRAALDASWARVVEPGKSRKSIAHTKRAWLFLRAGNSDIFIDTCYLASCKPGERINLRKWAHKMCYRVNTPGIQNKSGAGIGFYQVGHKTLQVFCNPPSAFRQSGKGMAKLSGVGHAFLSNYLGADRAASSVRKKRRNELA